MGMICINAYLALLLLCQTKLGINGKYFQVLFLRVKVPKATLRTTMLGNVSGTSEITCSLKCQNKEGCASAVIDVTEKRCLLMTTRIEINKKYSTSKKDKDTKMIFIQEKESLCGKDTCKNGGNCSSSQHGTSCSCPQRWTGHSCEVKVTATSCLDLKSKFRSLTSGYYELQWNGSKPFEVYCNMDRDGGGWTRVFHVRAKTTTAEDVTFQKYGSLQETDPSSNYEVDQSGLRTLKNRIQFKQLYFYCRNNMEDKTISIMTYKNATAVLQYMIGENNDRPLACGSYYRFKDDNSGLTADCAKIDEGKWGISNTRAGYIDHVIHIVVTAHFLVGRQRSECDNYHPSQIDRNDIWEVYVR